jgi:tetratricopeptide (TPR) repeat protein
VDEPYLNLRVGEAFAEGKNLGQAAVLFQRRLQLLPGDGEAELAMAKTYADLHLPDKSLELISELQKTNKVSYAELSRCEALAYMAGGDYAKAEKVLLDSIATDPNDENRVATLSEFYRARGVDLARENKTNEARRAFTNALSNISLQLRLLESDKHDTVPTFSVTDALLQKAQVEVALNSFAAAVATLSQVLQIQPKNSTALYNRALSEVQIKQFKAAKADYKELGKLLPDQPYIAEFGLAGVANAEGNKDDELYHLKRCIKLAPELSNEYLRATNLLEKLQHH